MSDSDARVVKTDKPSPIRQRFWLVYGALLVAGLLWLADAANYTPLQKTSARLGLGMVYIALSLIVANGRPAGWIATGIVGVSVILLFFV